MRLFHQLLDFILPTSCSYCRSPVGDSPVPYFCTSCWSDFTPIHDSVCRRCGKPFDSPVALSHSPGHECGTCRLNPPLFDQALAIGYFEGALREAVHQFKYRPCRALGRPLGQWMSKNICSISDIDMVMPVPLHAKRLKHRGFNQSLLLARQINVTYHIPLSYDNLLRVKATRPQVELSGEERIKNVAGAFALCRPGRLADTSIMLVDDVFTTGATMNECAAVLKSAGAAQVIAVTLARAV